MSIKLAQILTLVVFAGWALSVIDAAPGWLTIIVIAVLIIGALIARPFVEGIATSVIVATREAFSVGDEIEVDGIIGTVERIANRSTVIRTRDGRRVHIPNSEIIDKTVTVYTAYHERRSSIEVAVALDTDLDHIDTVIDDALTAVESITRVGTIRAVSFNEGVALSIRIWHGPHIVDANDAINAGVRHLKKAFKQTGIRFAPTSSIRIEEVHP